MKSQVNDYLEVMQAIYTDACVKCAAKVSIRDLKTIRSRVETQGISFLTITLPNFCSDFERSLELGYVDSKFFRSFRKNRSIPAFLQGMISQLFDIETGRINDDVGITHSPNVVCNLVASVRQICLAFKKIKLPCTPERVTRAMGSFIANEAAFNAFPLPKEDHDYFCRVSSVLWDNIIRNIRFDMLVPRHGPGQTAEHVSGNQKYVWRFWHHRLEPYFPLIDFGYPISMGEFDFNSEELKKVTMVYSDEEQPVRVVPVPKTLKGPRVIAIEPCCMQYAQQGVREALYDLLESHPLTAGHVNFRDQSINQMHALTSSADGQFATIDLSDASDRVPLGYALWMFRANPDLKDLIEACRSKTADVPGFGIVKLRKFASMGSALCFPVEAMYFYTLCVMALLKEHNLPVSFRNVSDVSKSVYVYGDDIVVPAHAAASVLACLQKYNCKVNERKTFVNGSFRESCGVDAFLGTSVTPIYLTRDLPKNRQQASELISCTVSANQFHNKGYWRTAEVLYKFVENVLGKLPFVQEGYAVLGRNQYCDTIPPKRFNRKYQRLEIKCWVQTPVYRTDKLEGYAALQKCLMKLEKLHNLLAPRDRFHLERSALHGEVAISRRWVPASLIAGHLSQ